MTPGVYLLTNFFALLLCLNGWHRNSERSPLLSRIIRSNPIVDDSKGLCRPLTVFLLLQTHFFISIRATPFFDRCFFFVSRLKSHLVPHSLIIVLYCFLGVHNIFPTEDFAFSSFILSVAHLDVFDPIKTTFQDFAEYLKLCGLISRPDCPHRFVFHLLLSRDLNHILHVIATLSHITLLFVERRSLLVFSFAAWREFAKFFFLLDCHRNPLRIFSLYPTSQLSLKILTVGFLPLFITSRGLTSRFPFPLIAPPPKRCENHYFERGWAAARSNLF